MPRAWKPFAQRITGMANRSAQSKSPFDRLKRRITCWLPRPIPKLRLSHQLLGFFVLVVLIPLLLLSFSIYSINQKALKKQVARFTEHTAEGTYQELRLEMSWEEEYSRLAAQYWQTLLENPSQSARQNQIHQFFRMYKNYEAVALFNPKGDRVAWFRSPQSRYLMTALPQHLDTIPEEIDFNLDYHPEFAKNDNLNYSLLVTVPGQLIGNNPRIGAIVFYKRFPYMGQLISERDETFQHGFVITDPNGVIMAGPASLLEKTLDPHDLKLFKDAREGIVKEFSSRKLLYGFPVEDEPDTPRLEKVIIKIPKLGWGLIIESPYSVQQHYILRARAQSVGLLILCIVVIILLGLLYSRGINRNFRQLLKGIKALAEGHYSRKIRLITKSWTPYEIVYLTAEINRMATKISSAWDSIQKLNQELVYKNQQDLFIAQATQRLHSSLETETVYQTAVQIMCEHPGVISAGLYLAQEGDRFKLAASVGKPLFNQGHSIQPDDAMLSGVLLDLRPVTLPAEPSRNNEPVASMVLHPISYQENGIGVLMLVKETIPGEIPHPHFDDALLLDLISGQIGVAIHQSRQWEQLQKANEQLSQLDELKSNLIDTVSHELRTPLTNIKGYTSRLIRYEHALDSDTKVKSLKVIKQQADRLGRLVEDLLVIPDLERTGGIRVYPDRVSLNELIHRCVAFAREKAAQEFQTPQLSPDLEILVDPDRMEQVLLNLLDNAIKYSPEDAVIEISAHQVSPTDVQIQVFNPCDPIPQEALATLFEKFTRLDERLTRTTRGTGLGLFITRGLVEAMGGKIWLEGNDGFRVLLEVPLFECTAHAPVLDGVAPERL